MCDDWIIAKNMLIDTYFADNKYMRDVAESAHNGSAYAQDKLADWFEEKGLYDLANKWRNSARFIREQMGSQED